mgnify:CR=1 FL=1
MYGIKAALDSGLSPRPRGSHFRAPACRIRAGSIPASAGEPELQLAFRHGLWVYPRVRGGAPHLDPLAGGSVGLSPRPRGSRIWRLGNVERSGSIPASAGEPGNEGWTVNFGGVYPRVRGGAAELPPHLERMAGLSPRPRGSQRNPLIGEYPSGSIPASAGEPYSAGGGKLIQQVYPRVRGGAIAVASENVPPLGLSPRPRGSQSTAYAVFPSIGSIPASAGEPRWRRARPRPTWVYPRVRGGAWGY